MISVTDQSGLFRYCFKLYQLINQSIYGGVVLIFAIFILWFIMIKCIFSPKHKNHAQIKMLSYSRKQNLSRNLYQHIRSLNILQKDLLIKHSLYKQLLYFKTNVYHSTSLNSIFSILKRHSQNFSQLKNSCEDILLTNIKTQIEVKIQKLILQITKVFHFLQSQRFDNFQNSSSLQRKQHEKFYKIKNFLKYNIKMRRQMEKHKRKLGELQYILKQFQQQSQNQSDKQYIDAIELGIFAILEIKTFINKLSDLIGPFNFQRYEETYGEFDLNLRIQKIHSQVQESFSTLEKIQNKKIINQTIESNYPQENSLVLFFKYVESFIANKKSSSYLKNLSYKLNQNPQLFYQKEINQLQLFEEQIRLFKQKIQKQSLQSEQKLTQSDQIKIYHSGNQSQSIQQSKAERADSQNFINTMTLKSKQKINQPQQQHITFTLQNKLSFIKQLDRLMIRNRIKRQMQEMDKKMKQQQEQQLNLGQEEQDESQHPSVTLEKI